MRYLLTILLLLALACPCEARRRYVPSSSVGSWPMPERIEPALQAVAQARADWMAANQLLDHYASGPPTFQSLGVSEGIGRGTSSDPKQIGTCVTGSIVVADAWAKASNGEWFRVRFFH